MADEVGYGGFAKLYGNRLADSSLLDCDVATRWVFIFMLSKADARGIFRCATMPGLARAANVSLAQADKAVEELQAPDPDSTSSDQNGRRILRIPGGWKLVTYEKYREYRTQKQMVDAARQQRHRDVSRPSRGVAPEAEADPEVDPEVDPEKKKKRPRTYADIHWSMTRESFVGADVNPLQETLKRLYADLRWNWQVATWASMSEWCVTHPEEIAAKKDLRAFILTWYRGDAKKERQR